MNHIKHELMKHGATAAQADGYLELIHKFEILSAGNGERHHILPVGCGWWGRYKRAAWNIAVVTWPLHIALHAYLMSVFPNNARLSRALTATAQKRPIGSPKKTRYKKHIIRQYSAGKSAAQIGRQYDLDISTIIQWLHDWGVKTRSVKESRIPPKKAVLRNKIIRLYQSGRSAACVDRRLKLWNGATHRWLHEWGIELRHGTSSLTVKKARVRSQIILWYRKGRHMGWISKQIKCTAGTIRLWLMEWGVQIRSGNDYRVLGFTIQK